LSADWPAGLGRLALAEVDSTNAEAARLAAAGAGPCWILADRQTGGRGRRGRNWDSPRGNFHATLLTYPPGPPAAIALYSFAAALALREALVALTGLPGAFALKWPNDVLLNGGKLAGILLESARQGGRVSHLAVGIGVNLIAAPDPAMVESGALRPVSLLAETGLRVRPEALLDRLAPALATEEARLAAEGFAPLRRDWLSHAARRGEPVTARTQTETLTGIFEDMDPTGALILATPLGRRSIPAADIYFD
jgi:BirA family biotin operon repressor/biotin-[acetyl-CoA-carboxylase] ligase